MTEDAANDTSQRDEHLAADLQRIASWADTGDAPRLGATEAPGGPASVDSQGGVETAENGFREPGRRRMLVLASAAAVLVVAGLAATMVLRDDDPSITNVGSTPTSELTDELSGTTVDGVATTLVGEWLVVVGSGPDTGQRFGFEDGDEIRLSIRWGRYLLDTLCSKQNGAVSRAAGSPDEYEVTPGTVEGTGCRSADAEWELERLFNNESATLQVRQGQLVLSAPESSITFERTSNAPPPVESHGELQATPQRIVAGETVELTFAGELAEGRGGYYYLDAEDGERLALLWTETEPEREMVPGFAVEGENWEILDYGLSGPGPEMILLPPTLPSGHYRVCTANSGPARCVEIEIDGQVESSSPVSTTAPPAPEIEVIEQTDLGYKPTGQDMIDLQNAESVVVAELTGRDSMDATTDDPEAGIQTAFQSLRFSTLETLLGEDPGEFTLRSPEAYLNDEGEVTAWIRPNPAWDFSQTRVGDTFLLYLSAPLEGRSYHNIADPAGVAVLVDGRVKHGGTVDHATLDAVVYEDPEPGQSSVVQRSHHFDQFAGQLADPETAVAATEQTG